MKKNKNILHVVNISFVLPYYIGEQFDHFSNKGFQFYVACTSSPHLLAYGKEKKFIAIPLDILRTINPIADIRTILLLRKKIKEHNIDLVIGHTPKGAMIGIIAAYSAGIKTRIYFRHGLMYETSTGLKRFLLKKIEQLTGILSTKVVCVSPSVLNKSNLEHLNNPNKNLILNRGTCNGMDSNAFCKEHVDFKIIEDLRSRYNLKPGEKVVGFVGRLVNDKGINELINAWKILLKDFGNIKLMLVGPFEDRDTISDEAKCFINTEQSIIHTGLISDVRPFYTLMNLFVLPSYREGFPTVVLEASSMELPVVTTRSTGCIDSIIENETGLFCLIDAVDLAEKMKIYLLNDHLAMAHGKNGRDFVIRNFSQKLIWDEIENKLLNI